MYPIHEIAIHFQGEELVGADLDGLLFLLLQKFDLEFEKIFLHSYQSFTNDRELFNKLNKIFDDVLTNDETRLRICLFISHWISHEFEHILSSGILPDIHNFIRFKIERISSSSDIIISNLTKTVMCAVESTNKKNIILPSIDQDYTCKLNIYKLKAKRLAFHLTLFTSDIFHHLHPREFFGNGWSKKELEHLSVDIIRMIDLFNRLSSLVVMSMTIHGHGKAKERAKKYKYWVKVANHFRNLHNFHLLLAVLSALVSSSISRMKDTLGYLSKSTKKIVTRLEEDIHPSNSYAKYRSLISNLKHPIIPYLGCHLQDLTFIEDGNSKYIKRTGSFIVAEWDQDMKLTKSLVKDSDKMGLLQPREFDQMINWRKCVFTVNVLELIRTLQRIDYTNVISPKNIPHHTEVIHVFQQTQLYEEEKCYQHSLQLEPRKEKDRNSLKN